MLTLHIVKLSGFVWKRLESLLETQENYDLLLSNVSLLHLITLSEAEMMHVDQASAWVDDVKQIMYASKNA